MFKFLDAILDSNEKVIKKIQPIIKEINELEPQYQALSDSELRNKTKEFRAVIRQKTVAERDGYSRLVMELESIEKRLNTSVSKETCKQTADVIEKLDERFVTALDDLSSSVDIAGVKSNAETITEKISAALDVLSGQSEIKIAVLKSITEARLALRRIAVISQTSPNLSLLSDSIVEKLLKAFNETLDEHPGCVSSEKAEEKTNKIRDIFKDLTVDGIDKAVDDLQGLEGSFDDEYEAASAECYAAIMDYVGVIDSVIEKIKDADNDEAVNNFDKMKNTAALVAESVAFKNEAQLQEMSERRVELKEEIKKAEKNLIEAERKVLDEILPQAFAAMREASRRTLGLRHYDVQLIGGVVLHRGQIAEMRTGEGKTLVATLALYLNALAGHGVHLITANDYLARRDAYWMGPAYEALGIKVASIYPMQDPKENLPARIYDPEYDSEDPNNPWPHFRPINRADAYNADITYGTSAEFGFDYLRDNMAPTIDRLVQRRYQAQYYAIVDEVDNLLIDEARTPLIISAPDTESSHKYQVFARLVKSLNRDVDYEVKEKEQLVEPSEAGYAKIEELLKREGMITEEAGLYDISNTDLMRHFRNALLAKELFKRDDQYIVKDGEIIIIDALTGRMMLGRRYSEGLHQAIEAKENVKVQNESKTYATITIQNYIRMYSKYAGMTGTAETEAEEFSRVYKLEVVVIPTNKPIKREDLTDLIYVDSKAKYKALINEIIEIHKTGRPILIGTVSIEKNQELDEMLKRRGIKHNTLNAKNHLKEADIIAEAGEKDAITLATNMAGRGVDIILGGKTPEKEAEETDETFQKRMERWQKHHDEVIALGGLYVLGTEHHEARRIDNQLRGRAGRQGDPGTSRFFVALDDDIIRKFGGDRVQGIMNWAGFDEDTPLENKMVSKTIENSQVRVEGYHFDIRKHIVEYDDVFNKQREVIYAERNKVITGNYFKDDILGMVNKEVEDIINNTFDYKKNEELNLDNIISEVGQIVPINDVLTTEDIKKMTDQDQIMLRIKELIRMKYIEKEMEIRPEVMRLVEKLTLLRTIDTLWIDHLTAMDYLRQSISMQAVAQQDPLVAYRRTASEMFEDLTAGIQHQIATKIYHVKVAVREAENPLPKKAMETPMANVAPKNSSLPANSKIGRNDPCYCGSGKKYKHCHGK